MIMRNRNTQRHTNLVSLTQKQGFTLIEMMITIVIAALLLTIAVPSFQQSIRNNRLTAEANNLLTALALARSEAIKRGSPVTVCASSNQSTCSNSSSWTTGWIVFVDQNADVTRDGTDCGTAATDDCLLQVAAALTGSAVLTGTTQFITYNSNGRVNATTTLTLKAASSCGSNEQRTISVNSTGRGTVTQEDCP